MYVCMDCEKRFFNPKFYFERHLLASPPYERHIMCPFCESENIAEIEVRHCRCCGARLRRENTGEYCNASCKRRGEKLWKMQEINRKKRLTNPIVQITNKLEEYNKSHGTNLSYGQFVARGLQNEH